MQSSLVKDDKIIHGYGSGNKAELARGHHYRPRIISSWFVYDYQRNLRENHSIQIKSF